MKKILLFVLSILVIFNAHLFAALGEGLRSYTGSAEFERLKSLVGTWKGISAEDDGTKFDADVEYYVTSNGSAVV